ncbi:hypothetical protein NDU88_002126 [Pleurodeles waltl]|uniref:Uncharacterized protein n=1 Tax=Pleurodeles waltl TaxID=8319 RepID=A0AAV7TLP4_PLEWA|nr:hypothetical protein NDU88_002126 [Pleurodeles waltl]
MKALLLTMQSSLSSIDGKMDTMTTRLDLLTAGLEKQSGRITDAEQRISHVADVMQKRQEQLLQMDKLLKVIALKNEDLEARSRRNNIRIVGIPESTNTGRMEQFVERLLFTLFGEDAFSRLLIALSPSFPGEPPCLQAFHDLLQCSAPRHLVTTLYRSVQRDQPGIEGAARSRWVEELRFQITEAQWTYCCQQTGKNYR